MIVVDTNILAALVLPTSQQTEAAVRLLEEDRNWVAPVLWRSELTNVLTTGVRNSWFELDSALEAFATAEEVMLGGEYRVPNQEVLRLAATHGCSGYDSEFVVLAQELEIPLVTLACFIHQSWPRRAIWTLSRCVGAGLSRV